MKFTDSGHCAASHIGNGCPESEWSKGVVARNYFDGKLNHIIVCRDLAAAEDWVLSQVQWRERKINEYEEAGLPVPPQFYKWTFRVG